MTITQATFQNFKALRDVTVPLTRFTVIVGPNGAGKTSILEGLYFLSRLLRGPEKFQSPPTAKTRHVLVGIDQIYSQGGQGSLNLSFLAGSDSVRLVVRTLNTEELQRVNEQFNDDLARGKRDFDDELPLTYESKITFTPSPDQDEQPLEDHSQKSQEHLKQYGSSVLLRLNSSKLAAPSYSDRDIPRVESDGDGLASALAFLKAEDADKFNAIVKRLREVIPEIRDVHPKRAKVSRTENQVVTVQGTSTTVATPRDLWGHALYFDTSSAKDISASQMSEGTLIVLGLLTVMAGSTPPRLLLLDDLDRALHPRAQASLVDVLRNLLDANKDLQIVATSHSPYLIDKLEPEEVLLTSMDDEKGVQCASLVKHPDFEQWKDEMMPGEFWSTVGEDWVREPRLGEAKT